MSINPFPPNIVLVGSSGFGATVAAPTLSKGNAVFHGVLGSRPDSSATLAAQYDVRAYRTLEEVLDDPKVDALWIAATDAMHEPLGLAALQAGKHVLIEKPLGRTMAECRSLLSAAQEASGCVSRLGLNQRFRPGYQQLREGIRAGRIGAIRHLRMHFFMTPFPPGSIEGTSRGSRKQSGGVWIMKEFGAHLLDQLLWLCDEPVTVGAAMRNHLLFDIETDDTSSILLRIGSKAVATIEVSAAVPGPSDSYHVHGETGSVRGDGLFFGGGTIEWNSDPIINLGGPDWLQPYFAQLDDFVGAIGGAPSIGATFADGVAIQRLIDAACVEG